MALFIFRGRWLGRFIGVAIRVGGRPGCARVGVRICYGIFIVSIPGLWMFGLGILARSTCSCSCPMNLFTKDICICTFRDRYNVCSYCLLVSSLNYYGAASTAFLKHLFLIIIFINHCHLTSKLDIIFCRYNTSKLPLKHSLITLTLSPCIYPCTANKSTTAFMYFR